MPKPIDDEGPGHRNPGIQEQQKSASYWKRRAMALQPLEDAYAALTIDGVKEYLSALGPLHHAAHNPLKRGAGDYDLAYRTDLHRRKKTNGPAKAAGETGSAAKPIPHSAPPSHDPRAFAMLRAEDRKCKRLAADVLLKLDELVGETGDSKAA